MDSIAASKKRADVLSKVETYALPEVADKNITLVIETSHLSGEKKVMLEFSTIPVGDKDPKFQNPLQVSLGQYLKGMLKMRGLSCCCF